MEHNKKHWLSRFEIFLIGMCVGSILGNILLYFLIEMFIDSP